MSSGVHDHFEAVAGEYDAWKKRSRYYHSAVKQAVAEVVPPGSRVLEVGCGTGDVLAHLRPGEGLGTDLSAAMVRLAARKYPHLRFAVHDLMGPSLDERFPYVVAVDVAEHVPDLDAAMRCMAAMLEPEGTLVVITANPLWSPVLHLAERLGLKMPEGDHEWRSNQDLFSAAEGAGLTVASFSRRLLVPKAVLGLHRLNTCSLAGRIRNRYGLVQRATFNPGQAASPESPEGGGAGRPVDSARRPS